MERRQVYVPVLWVLTAALLALWFAIRPLDSAASPVDAILGVVIVAQVLIAIQQHESSGRE